MRVLLDGVRFALSFLTVAPVPAPRVDRAVAGTAIALAPLVGALLGGLAALVVAGLVTAGAPPLLAAALAVGSLALLTRGLHLDGLADTADGLGSARPPAAAREVMRRSDIGPFGVVTLVLVLLLQVSALAALVEIGQAAAGLVIALATGRAAATVASRPGVPPARAEGLGALVAGSVPRRRLALVLLALVAGAAGAAVADDAASLAAVASALTGLLVALALERHAVRRLEGVTGDVYGALIETGTTATLVVAAVLL